MGISRRNFIKAGAATTAAIGLSGSLFSSEKWFQPVEAKGNSLEKTAFTYHTISAADTAVIVD